MLSGANWRKKVHRQSCALAPTFPFLGKVGMGAAQIDQGAASPLRLHLLDFGKLLFALRGELIFRAAQLVEPVQLDKPVKALSVRQPFADFIVHGVKPIENRVWQTPYRGLVYIHAAVLPHSMSRERIETVFGVKLDGPSRAFGAIVGRAVLVDIVRHSSSRWFRGPYGWVFEHAEEIEPVRMRGAQGLFDVTLPGV
jgi:hypothetical protein